MSSPWEVRRTTGAFNIFISDWEPAPAELPEGVGVWAIGDIHGHLGHFDALLAGIEPLMADAPAGPRHLVIMGDTIDRGPDNIAALERSAALSFPGVIVTRLLGNHEEYLRTFLTGDRVDDAFLEQWAMNGGHTTLANLGVSPVDLRRHGARAVVEHGRSVATAKVRDALEGLKIGMKVGGYVFVHAGVHPRFPLEDEANQRLTEIREPFLTGSGWIHDFVVVHGHSIVGPDIAPHRIAVDSGAYYTGVLTCVELSGKRARFIAATQDNNLEALLKIRGRRPLSRERWRRA